MERKRFLDYTPAGRASVSTVAGNDVGAGGPGSKGIRPTFVLVHGAWHGGWCWSETVALLAEQGFRAIAVDLPGHGYKAKLPAAYLAQPQNPAALSTEVSALAALTIDDYRDYTLKIVRGLVKQGSGPVILVGHSLGGATRTAVAEAEPSLIHKLVYVTAFVPVKLDSAVGYIMRPEFAASEVPPLFAADPEVVGCIRINYKSSDAGYVAKSKSAFCGDIADADYLGVANLLTPDEPIQAFAGKVVPTIACWGSVPRAFVRCAVDCAIPLAGQDAMIAEADEFTPHNKFEQKTLISSHSPFLSQPRALVATLVALV